MTIDIAAKDWNVFNTTDPYNPGNVVGGKISRHQGDDYGALLIETINCIPCPQIILCTPKMKYPFDDSGNWHFPKAKVIEAYTKLDGTNLFQFNYHDATGAEFISYKTRLVPFLQNSRFGPFFDMWQEMLKQYPNISKLPYWLNANLSYELYGLRNPHLIKYNIPLTCSLLFGRRDGKIIPPSAFTNTYSVTTANKTRTIDKEYVYCYQEAQKELQAKLKQDEEYYTGDEGEVWYVGLLDGTWQQFKMKPETIEQIHWSQGGIGKNTIRATIQNAFENWDNPTIEQIKQLLLEEFSVDDIEKVHYAIDKILKNEIQTNEFREQVLLDYKNTGLSILNNKQIVMRALSNKYKKEQMKKVYSFIWAKEAK